MPERIYDKECIVEYVVADWIESGKKVQRIPDKVTDHTEGIVTKHDSSWAMSYVFDVAKTIVSKEIVNKGIEVGKGDCGRNEKKYSKMSLFFHGRCINLRLDV